jgi:hypothetical protein
MFLEIVEEMVNKWRTREEQGERLINEAKGC